MSKKKHKKRERIISIPIEITEETGKTISLCTNFQDQKATLFDSHGSIFPPNGNIRVVYQGEMKEKTELGIPFSFIPLSDVGLLDRYKRCYSIDTNYKLMNGIYVAIGVMIKWNVVLQFNAVAVSPLRICVDCFPDIWCPKGIMKYENYMWSNFISKIGDSHPDGIKEQSIIVVDSDYDNLKKYNNKEPFFKGPILPCVNAVLTLPDEMSFVYAKADAASTSVLNVMIKTNDKSASRILSELSNYEYAAEDKNDLRADILKDFKSMEPRIKDIVTKAYKELVPTCK